MKTVRLSDYPETDSLYIDLSPKTTMESVEISDGIVIDLDEYCHIAEIGIDSASYKTDIKRIVLNRIPAQILAIAA